MMGIASWKTWEEVLKIVAVDITVFAFFEYWIFLFLLKDRSRSNLPWERRVLYRHAMNNRYCMIVVTIGACREDDDIYSST